MSLCTKKILDCFKYVLCFRNQMLGSNKATANNILLHVFLKTLLIVRM